MRWIVKVLFRLRLTALLRGFGIRLPWILEEIEQEWFGGLHLNWDRNDLQVAFDVATRIRGLRWVLGEQHDTTLFSPFPGIGRRGGYSEFLRVYWFGIRMASIAGATGADDLMRRIIAGDPDASEE